MLCLLLFMKTTHTAFGSFSRHQVWKMKKDSGEYSNSDMFALAVTLDSKQVTQARLGSPTRGSLHKGLE